MENKYISKLNTIIWLVAYPAYSGHKITQPKENIKIK